MVNIFFINFLVKNYCRSQCYHEHKKVKIRIRKEVVSFCLQEKTKRMLKLALKVCNNVTHCKKADSSEVH